MPSITRTGRASSIATIKPDNILIDGATGGPLLMDFGIAKATLGDAQLTTDGQLLGTPHYMSPEQALGRPDVGPQSDLYSLGVVAYEMVSAQRPFEATTAMEAVTQRLTHEPRPLASIAGHVPRDMAQAINRCLQKDPAHRWPDARSLREALLPSEEEPENTFDERLLRISTSVLLLALVVWGYATVVMALAPGLQLSPRARSLLLGMPLGFAAPMVLAWIVAAARLRAQGMDLGSVVRKAFSAAIVVGWLVPARVPAPGRHVGSTAARAAALSLVPRRVPGLCVWRVRSCPAGQCDQSLRVAGAPRVVRGRARARVRDGGDTAARDNSHQVRAGDHRCGGVPIAEHAPVAHHGVEEALVGGAARGSATGGAVGRPLSRR
jgi:hypothetical protein